MTAIQNIQLPEKFPERTLRALIPAGFPDDWATLVNQAINSDVCNQPGDGGKCNPLGP